MKTDTTPLVDHLVLERIGPADATVGMVSLPLPREVAADVRLDHPRAGMQPVGWWVRHELPRRSLGFVVDDRGVPETVRATTAAAPGAGPASSAGSPRWTAASRVTCERLDYKRPRFSDIASLRGMPAADCTCAEGELVLSYGGRELMMQFGATGPGSASTGGGGPYAWQNVQVDELWENDAVQAVRVGGVVYNGDTYLWADLYLLLFANGVAHATAHFVNTRLHIEGYDFQGVPLIRFDGTGIRPVAATLPRDGSRFDLGLLRLNLDDAASLCGEDHPARLVPGSAAEGPRPERALASSGSLAESGGVAWYPFSRTFNPQLDAAPETEWAPGFARTVRFQFSLSAAAPVIARYRVPAWWYGVSGEPWPGGYLPVHGRYSPASARLAETIRGNMRRGRFDAGNAGYANDGYAGIGLLRNYYHSGPPELFHAGLDYCYYWADLAVDHRDFTVHQWIGGWPWKTCAYTKFRDVLMGYLETGDPYLLDTVENCADTYWSWFRANWPRCTIGRDSFEVGGWALLRRYLGSERARERSRELARMMATVIRTRGSIGGQLGAGPHPGYISSLYMTGVAMLSLSETAEAEAEERATAAFRGARITAERAPGADTLAELRPVLDALHARWMRMDIEMFPSSYGHPIEWGDSHHAIWTVLSSHIYPQVTRLYGRGDESWDRGLRRSASHRLPDDFDLSTGTRPGDTLVNPLYHDALMLGARLVGDGLELDPLGEPGVWPATQTVETPWGALRVHTASAEEGGVLRFEAEREFPVVIRYQGRQVRTTSRGEVALAPRGVLV